MAAAIVDDPPGHLEWPFMADWVWATTTAYWHSGSQNLNLLIDRYGGSYLTGVGREESSMLLLVGSPTGST